MTENKIQECYFCSDEATSREHIPPTCIFNKPYPGNMITVPSCDSHNSRKSCDDEYLKWVLVTASVENSEVALGKVNSILRAFKRSPRFCTSALSRPIDKIDIYSPEGIYIKSRPGYKIEPTRIQNILDMICAGLFFKMHNKKLDHSVKFERYIFYPKINIYQVAQLPEYAIGDGSVFKFKAFSEEGAKEYYWLFMFYGWFPVMCKAVGGALEGVNCFTSRFLPT